MSLNLSSLLNPEQAKAASNIEGPELIIAGAGSGKTRMITYRIANMLDKGIAEKNILALTFTNKAAKEMSERIKEVTGKKLKDLTATTFHSFGLGILKQYIHHIGYHNDFTLYDDNDNTALIKDCVNTCGYESDNFKASTLKAIFSDIKTGRMQITNQDSAVAEIYKEWILTQKAYNVVDFDDLILLPIRIFEKKPFVLDAVQERFKYIMVDEFQDTSLLQYKLISTIAKKYRNICVVGDDDQSIYSWRGANYQNIVMFEQDFPERKEFKLERNYRSSGNILKAANTIITNNKERKEKVLWTDEGEGAMISIMRHKDGAKEAYWISKEIRKEMRAHKYNYSDFGVLVRTNSLISEIENTFVEEQLPVKISGGQSFFEKKEIRDILCYLKILINDKDDASLLRIINTPRRGIGRTSVEKLRCYADKNNVSLSDAIKCMQSSAELKKNSQESLRTFSSLLSKWRSLTNSPKGLIDIIISDIGYEGMLRNDPELSEKAIEYKMRSISFLKDRMTRYLEINKDSSLRDYLNAVSIIGDDQDDKSNKVNLMTMHASKGLEFKVVYLAGIEDNIIPSSRALEENQKNIDEERRLFYVAITRAREKLVINYCDNRINREGEIKMAMPSRFISEIPVELFKNEEKSAEEIKKDSMAEAKAILERMRAKSNTK